MISSNLANEIENKQDLARVDIQLRDTKDLFITCPPLSGLSVFLKQIQRHILVSDHFRDYKPLLFDCKTKNTSKNLFDGLVSFAFDELGLVQPHKGVKGKGKTKLSSAFMEIAKKNERQKNVFIIENIEKIPEKDAVTLLESVRVIAEERSKNSYLRNVIFILAGHSLDLRKLDPKHSSPFNTATQIYLEDLSTEDSVTVVKALLDKRYSPLVPAYVDFLTCGHPYLIEQVCYHAKSENIRIDAAKGVTFELIDSVIDRIINDRREEFFRNLEGALEELSSISSTMLRKILNGAFIKSVKNPDALKELKLFGIINNNRDGRWRIRNYFVDHYIRQRSEWSDTIRDNDSIPRRLFANIEGYKILFNLENNLREFVVSQLFCAFGSDWKKVISRNSTLGEMATKWNNLKKSDLGIGWLAHDDLPSVCYGLFPEIKMIIDEYWGGMFEKYFKPKKIFEGTFESLEELRNKIAHNRPLSDTDIEVLVSIANQFNDCMYENTLSER